MKLKKSDKRVFGTINLPASKSEANRALIIEALLGKPELIQNVSTSQDTVTLQAILKGYQQGIAEFDVGPAGTTMRFLTAFFSLQKGTQTLTGSDRMKQRPIGILVNALRELGASIEYLEKVGYPPIKINESKFSGSKFSIDGGVSSQYISALMLIAPMVENGLEIEIKGELVSRPYLQMTAQMMQYFGAEVKVETSRISVKGKSYIPNSFAVESDWSAASYWYEIVAFAEEAEIELIGLKNDSLQGDAIVKEIFKNFGVKTKHTSHGVRLSKEIFEFPKQFVYDFTLCPDLAQTVAVTCAGLGIDAKLTGLKTLRIKETDRILALEQELIRLGFNVTSGEDWLQISSKNSEFRIQNSEFVKTYEDHRMAMAFAPLAMFGEIEIENHEVVGKSYPNFWKDLEKVGFS